MDVLKQGQSQWCKRCVDNCDLPSVLLRTVHVLVGIQRFVVLNQ